MLFSQKLLGNLKNYLFKKTYMWNFQSTAKHRVKPLSMFTVVWIKNIYWKKIHHINEVHKKYFQGVQYIFYTWSKTKLRIHLPKICSFINPYVNKRFLKLLLRFFRYYYHQISKGDWGILGTPMYANASQIIHLAA